jgi:hypothetical protein
MQQSAKQSVLTVVLDLVPERAQPEKEAQFPQLQLRPILLQLEEEQEEQAAEAEAEVLMRRRRQPVQPELMVVRAEQP